MDRLVFPPRTNLNQSIESVFVHGAEPMTTFCDPEILNNIKKEKHSQISEDDMNLFNHSLKCRLCLASFDEYEYHRIPITETVLERITLMGIKVT